MFLDTTHNLKAYIHYAIFPLVCFLSYAQSCFICLKNRLQVTYFPEEESALQGQMEGMEGMFTY